MDFYSICDNEDVKKDPEIKLTQIFYILLYLTEGLSH